MMIKETGESGESQPAHKELSCARVNGKTASTDRLQLLILSKDTSLVQTVRAALQDMNFADSYARPDSAQAVKVLDRRHFDGIILDCDDLACGQEILRKIRTGASNRHTPVIAIFNGAADLRVTQDCAANFNVFRPVSSGTIKAQLNNAFDAMRRENRRYFRYAVSLPLFVGAEGEDFTPARLINVSEEGLAVLSSKSANLEKAVSLRFDLPSIEPYRIEAGGVIAWADAAGRIGIKLSHMPAEARRKYGEWLEVLHSQHEFRRLTEEASQL